MKLIDTSKLKYHYKADMMAIDDELIYDDTYGYNTYDKEYLLSLKPLGRIYFSPLQNLDYVDGTPVEAPYITGGEKGMIDKYLKAGARVYTEEMVLNILKSKLYENSDELKPKLPEDLHNFLVELSENKAKDKPQRAKEFLDKYKLVGYEAH